MSSEESVSEEEEWEEVESIEPKGSHESEFTEEQLAALARASQSSTPAASGGPARGIEITLGKDTLGKRKNKDKSEFEKAFEAFQKQLLHGTHKAHLLCLLSHGVHQSRVCDIPSLQAVLLSLVVSEAELLSSCSENFLLKLTRWLVCNQGTVEEAISESLPELQQDGMVGEVSVVQLLVALLRVLRHRARLVLVLRPLSYKPMPVKKETKKLKTFSAMNSPNKTGGKDARVGKKAKTDKKKGKLKATKGTPRKTKVKSTSGPSTTECDTSPYFKTSMRSVGTRKRSHSDVDTSIDSVPFQTPPPSDDEVSENDYQPPKRKKKKMVKQKLSKQKSNEPSSVGQFSSGDTKEPSECVEQKSVDSWVEVYMATRKKWVCVHLQSSSVDQPHLCERDSHAPLNYVVAFETGAESARPIVRDVTPRYASDWCTRVYKQRLDRDWWAESLQPFQPLNEDEKKNEDQDIIAMLNAQPLPSSVSEYKNHPLYALKRHLLKFEVIHPEDSEVLGFCRGEPVYSRSSVHTLHTRETWLKEGRMIRVGESALKSVKARPKKGQSVLENQQRSTVEVYGKWQTEDYIPQPIVNGKVPRNEYGNVELFQPSMLPPGGAHIKIQGIQRVARKLGIDYAPAMMGWDFHGGFCHPIIEGIVVAEENEGVIMEAWEQEEQIRIDKAVKKKEKRVVDRWRKFTKALLIKERLKQKYEYTT